MTQLHRALGIAGLSTGAVLAAAGGASAEILPRDLGAAGLPLVPTVVDSTMAAVNPVLDLQLDPLANTSTDPLSNAAGTQVADFQPISTAAVTGPLTSGASLRTLPGEVVGGLLGGLPVRLP
ncbi:hypothetical protein [Streptomyces litchfieldiae]|uniref:Secreted protein n=1 Tax=Streptomyces litchfieldiae TaxID=3075543 RepID=A0ABU2N1R2_9ACTN|nr:hypothetical protein [Streptomyces sp. DSM 44938]MDT0346689.1 hypothetical protein [Streptomyces sp. DSM 44938]